MSKKIETGIEEFKMLQQDRKFNLARFSQARVGLGHTGGHSKTLDWLDFQRDFAQAKDAVFSHFDEQKIINLCHQLQTNPLVVHSRAPELKQFLLRPDLGRQLSQQSAKELENYIDTHPDVCQKDVLIVVSGGLSPVAIERQIPQFLPILIAKLRAQNLSIAPIMIAQKSRVAFGDHINQFLRAEITIMLIGERPGLTTPDSLGIYMTYHAKPGCTDEVRNCISNIHFAGLSAEDAATKVIYLIGKILAEKRSGVLLKDDFHELLIRNDHV